MPPTTTTRPTNATDDVFTALPREDGHASMKFHEAINFVEGRTDRHAEYIAAKHAIEQHLTETVDLEEKGVSYYYLLRMLLADRLLHENHTARELYTNMLSSFHGAETSYRTELGAARTAAERDIVTRQLDAFYQLVDSYIRSLEILYDEKGFLHASERANFDRMKFRRKYARHSGQHLVHLGHLFLEHSSRYGHSFGRWGVTVMLFVALYAGFYATVDLVSAASAFDRVGLHDVLDYFYFSIVTFMTVGYGDIVPHLPIEKILAGAEAVTGYVLLGIFLTLIQKRL